MQEMIKMDIHMIIFNGKKDKSGYVKPMKFNFSGVTALEDCILKLCEIFFSPEIKEKVEDYIRIDRKKLDEIEFFGVDE
jgi:hypothetical protein